MAKQPYVKFYGGDYIKDTRILPLNVRGAWTDLIIFMSENDPKGEISGTIKEYARLMCCTQKEAILVIQILKEKRIINWEELPNNVLKIISRKQKKMAELSAIRKETGSKGGNPKLVNQNLILNPEYEYEYKEDDMIVREMESIWRSKMTTYAWHDVNDLPALLKIAYLIAERKGWKRTMVLRDKEYECISSWKKIVDFLILPGSSWFRNLTLDTIGTSKMFQKIEQAMLNIKGPERKLSDYEQGIIDARERVKTKAL